MRSSMNGVAIFVGGHEDDALALTVKVRSAASDVFSISVSGGLSWTMYLTAHAARELAQLLVSATENPE